MKMISVFMPAMIFVMMFLGARPDAASAQSIFIEPLRLNLTAPVPSFFYVDVSALTRGNFREEFGSEMEFGYVIFDNRRWAVRSALALAAAFSDNGGAENDIEVRDFWSQVAFYLDLKAGAFRPYIGIGGGYNYRQEELDDVDDNDGTAVLVGHLGAGWQVAEKGNWLLTLGYSYVYGLEKITVETRLRRLDISDHHVRIGVRVGF